MESANDDSTEIVCPVVSLIINYVCLSFSFSFSWSTYFSQSYLDQVRKQLRCTNYNNLAFSANTSNTTYLPTIHTYDENLINLLQSCILTTESIAYKEIL